MIYYFLLIPYILIPLIFYLKRWHHALMLWIIQGIFLDIFAVQLIGNISAFKVAGLVLSPFMIPKLKDVFSTLFGKLLGFQIVWLIITFIIYGLLFPWENHTRFDQIQGSYIPAIKLMVNNISEFFLVIYLGFQMRDKEKLKWAVKCLFISAFVCMAGIYLEKFLRFDFYHFFTNGRKLLIPSRMRGFTFEPRAAAQYMAYLFVMLLTTYMMRAKHLILILPFVVMAFVLAKSMSGFVLMGAGIIIMLAGMIYINHKHLKRNLLIIAVLSVCSAFYFSSSISIQVKKYISAKSYILTAKSFSSRFEYADAAAVAFLLENPKHILIGAGTGESSIATSDYVREQIKKKYPGGIDYRPLMGVVLGLINGGLVLIFIQIAFILIGLKAILSLVKSNNDPLYKDLFIYFLVFTALYYLQIRYVHVFSFALALMAVLQRNEKIDK